MKRVFILIVFLSLVVSSAYADNPKDHASWWIKNYGVVDSKMDPGSKHCDALRQYGIIFLWKTEMDLTLLRNQRRDKKESR